MSTYNTAQVAETRSLWLLLAGSLTFIIGVGLALASLFKGTDPNSIRIVLGAVAIVGVIGCAWFFEQGGTRIIEQGGKWDTVVLARYKNAVLFDVYGSITALFVSTIACGATMFWAEYDWARFVLGFSISSIMVAATTLILLKRSATSWANTTEALTPSPYKTDI